MPYAQVTWDRDQATLIEGYHEPNPYVFQIDAVNTTPEGVEIKWSFYALLDVCDPLPEYEVKLRDTNASQLIVDEVVHNGPPVRSDSGTVSTDSLGPGYQLLFSSVEPRRGGLKPGGAARIETDARGEFPRGKLDSDNVDVVANVSNVEQVRSGEVVFTHKLMGIVRGGEPVGQSATREFTYEYGGQQDTNTAEITFRESTKSYTLTAGEVVENVKVELPAPPDEIPVPQFPSFKGYKRYYWRVSPGEASGGLGLSTERDLPVGDSELLIESISITQERPGGIEVNVTVTNDPVETFGEKLTQTLVVSAGGTTRSKEITVPPYTPGRFEAFFSDLPPNVEVIAETDDDRQTKQVATGAEPVVPSLSIECAFGGADVTTGQTVTIPATVTTGSGQGEATGTVTFELAGATATKTVRLGPNSSTTVEATFEVTEPGGYTPEVTVE